MWWLLLSAAVPGMVFALFGCGSDRKDVKKKEQSKRSAKSKKGGTSSKSTRSGKKSSRKPGHKSSSKSKKSSRSGKSSKSKSGRSKSRSPKKTKQTQLKSAKSGKSGKSARKNKSTSTSQEKSVKSVRTPVNKPVAVAVAAPQIVELRAEPAEMNFEKTGGLQTFKFINESNELRAFKVKCSDNQMYRVTPVFGVVKPHGSVLIDILRQNGAAKVEKLVLMTTRVDASAVSEKEPKQIMAAAANCQMTVVPLLVEA